MNTNLSRREFLKRLAQLSAARMSGATALSLMAARDAAAFTAGDDYKALVMVHLNGGNDHNSLLIPLDDFNYTEYARHRTGTAIAQEDILGLEPSSGLAAGMQMGLHSSFKNTQKLFEQGNAAVLQNVGILVEPLSREEYRNNTVPVPPHLFAHNHQRNFNQSIAFSDKDATTGWAGKIGDLAAASNGQNDIFTCMNASGDSLFLQGDSVSSYSFNSDGARQIDPLVRGGADFGSSRYREVMQKLLTQDSNHIMEKEIARIANRSISAQASLSDAFGDNSPFIQNFDGVLGSSFLAVARAIRASAQLGLKRQLFVISHEGYDLHGGIGDQAGLYEELDTQIGKFYEILEDQNMSDQVTLFTGSEFGRTLTVNGDGTDHGWGGHHLIYGGAVDGGKFYGETPEIGLNTETDIGFGRLLPTTAQQQFTSTLAKWFGVSDSELTDVVPDIGNFNTEDLGFMKS